MSNQCCSIFESH